jgi:putative transposase
MAEIRVFYQDRFLCRAICPELSGETVSLKEIEKARAARRKQVKAGLSARAAVVEQFIAVHQEEAPRVRAPEPEQAPARPRLKRYWN